MKKIVVFSSLGLLVVLMAFTFSSCNNSKNLGGHYTYETECLGSNHDGSYTLRAWGIGRNKPDALRRACKIALTDMIFKGISKGKTECETKPILMEVNAQEKYKKYFNEFFSNNGAYKEFINYRDRRTGTKTRERTDIQIKYGVTVTVFREELVKRLEKDGILKH